MKQLIRLPLGAAIALLATQSQATTGYFFHGYGVKAQGSAGTSIANFQDALTIANNPSGLSWIDSRADIGATLFSPDRNANITGNLAGANGNYDGNGRQYFLIPEFAINKQLNHSVDVGLAVYGNGGMNTGYKQNPLAAFGNSATAGVDLTQVFIAPALAWQYTPNQSIGLAANFLYQRFEAKGIQGFAAQSVDSSNFSNKGKDSATGLGARIGWSGRFFDNRLTLGANYASKINADRFKKYQGLFAESGDFDVPENYGVGLNYQLTSIFSVSADAQRIHYSDVAAVGNTLQPLFAGNAFGSQHGPGFGWDDINIYKVGVNYQASPQLVLRAGYSHNDQPIRNDQTLLNILAPGVITDHVSVGATYALDERQELSLAYTYALLQDVQGAASIPTLFGGGEANIEMQQHILGVSYGLKF